MFFILALFMAAKSPPDKADLLIVNARVHALAAGPAVSAIAIRNGRVLAVGNDLTGLAGPATLRIDARGATIVPGFIDSHGHMLGLGDDLETLDLREVRTVPEVAAIVKRQTAGRGAGEWIRGRGWDQTNWGGSFPSAADLEGAAPDHPVALSRVDGHALWVNRRALDIAGITTATADPPGGRIVRDSAGAPTGVLIDRAGDLITSRIPPASPADIRRRLERAARECARLGLTTVHDAGVSGAELAAYRDLIAQGQLPIRIYAMIGGAGPLWREYLKKGPEIGERLTVRSIKLLADGALGSRGAALLEPYADDPGNRGLTMLTREQIEGVAREAVAQGFQVNTHAIGDRANRMVLEAYGAALGGKNDRRFRIEHAQVVAPRDFELFAKYSIVASVQATHATSDMRWAEQRLGSERVRGAYAWRRFLSLGVRVPDGSDFPVESPNPLWGLYAAITRQDRDGNPPGGWFPGQRMTAEEALRSWTIDGAWAAFQEREKGSLEPGKLADLVMLSEDITGAPPSRILKARVLMTMVGGKVVYQEGK
jgi:predicted amidohydrolase YtcJ